MSNTLDSCLVSGPYGELILSPSEFIIPSGSIQTTGSISITFNPSELFFQSPTNVICIIELRTKQEELIPIIQPILTDIQKSIYEYQEIEPGKFQLNFKPSQFSRNISTNFSFNLSVPEFREEYGCATLNVDCVASGFGFVYNYFTLVGVQAPPERPEQITDPLPPPPRNFEENILAANSYYTFYIENYENLLSFSDSNSRPDNLNNEIINENMLPNINVLSLLHSNNKNINQTFLNTSSNFEMNLTEGKFADFSSENNNALIGLASLGGLIDGESSINLPSNNNLNNIFSSISYFEELSNDILNIYETQPTSISNYSYQNSKAFLFNSQYEKVIYPKINNIKNLFPMYSHIYVDNELLRTVQSQGLSYLTRDDLSEEERQLNFADTIQKSKFFSDSILKSKFNRYLESKKILDYFYYCLTSEIAINDTKSIVLSFINPQDNDFNIKYFGSNSDDNYQNIIDTTYVTYIGDFDYIEEGAFRSNTDNAMVGVKLDDTNFFEEFLTDQILLYRIDKWRADDITNLEAVRDYDLSASLGEPLTIKPLQTYYIINNFDSPFLELIDSQVKFEKEYEYRLYRYSTSIDTNGATVIKEFIESIKTRINDDPPVPPSLQIVPYKNNDTNFLILCSPSSGRFYERPIAILEEDNEQINLLLSSSIKKDEGKIQFEGDDLIARYQIMRLGAMPNSYSDFSSSQIFDITAYENGTAEFVDTIQPNTKYYYLARSVDVHNKFSNPTTIYEIEIINESGTIYLRKRIIDLEEKKFNLSKDMDNFIQIKPSLKQLEGRFESENLIIGSENSKIWDKNYILRLTSKTTGKKIDIKFKFKYQTTI